MRTSGKGILRWQWNSGRIQFDGFALLVQPGGIEVIRFQVVKLQLKAWKVIPLPFLVDNRLGQGCQLLPEGCSNRFRDRHDFVFIIAEFAG